MCEKVINVYPFALYTVPNCFVTPKKVEVLDYVEDLYKLIIWHYRYKQHKTYEKKIYDELMSTARHPSRIWDWCMPEDEKKEIEKL